MTLPKTLTNALLRLWAIDRSSSRLHAGLISPKTHYLQIREILNRSETPCHLPPSNSSAKDTS